MQDEVYIEPLLEEELRLLITKKLINDVISNVRRQESKQIHVTGRYRERVGEPDQKHKTVAYLYV